MTLRIANTETEASDNVSVLAVPLGGVVKLTLGGVTHTAIKTENHYGETVSLLSLCQGKGHLITSEPKAIEVEAHMLCVYFPQAVLRPGAPGRLDGTLR